MSATKVHQRETTREIYVFLDTLGQSPRQYVYEYIRKYAALHRRPATSSAKRRRVALGSVSRDSSELRCLTQIVVMLVMLVYTFTRLVGKKKIKHTEKRKFKYRRFDRDLHVFYSRCNLGIHKKCISFIWQTNSPNRSARCLNLAIGN